MMERFGTDIEYALEAHDRPLAGFKRNAVNLRMYQEEWIMYITICIGSLRFLSR